MSRVDAAAPDRLPWLPDEPRTKPVKRRGSSLVAWGAAVLVAVAGAGFWIGVRSVQDLQPVPARPAAPTATIQLPAPRAAEPEVRLPATREVAVATPPQVRPAPVRVVRISPPPTVKSTPVKEEKAAAVPEEQAKAETVAPVAQAPQYVPPKPWNPRVFQGAAGRVVQIGAFGSIHQAKLGWRYMVRSYPAVAHLPAVVRPTRNSRGRIFYRFQIGTTSQAHSEVLCQRMQHIRFSCAVVGLPWKAKVER